MPKNEIAMDGDNSMTDVVSTLDLSDIAGSVATLDVIGNHLLLKAGLAPVQWQRYFQPTEKSSWASISEAEAEAHFERSKPALVAACATNYLEVSDDERTDRNDAYYLSKYVWFDIDRDTPEDAIKQAHKFVRKLEATDLDLRCLRIYASGKKGFHIFVPLSAFVDDWWDTLTASEMRWFPAICKQVAEALYVDGLDTRVYSAGKGRQFREAAIKRDIGTFKVPLTLDEFWSITPNLYAEYVSCPRPEIEEVVPAEVNYTLAGIWDEAAAKVEGSAGAKDNAVSAPVTDAKIMRLKSILQHLHRKRPPNTVFKMNV